MLTPEEKRQIVSEVADVAAGAQLAIAALYRGMKVEDLTALRRQARAAGVYVRVVKNTLMKRAVDGTPFACMQDQLKDPLLYSFAADPASMAKIINDFAKQNDKLVIKVVALNGKLLRPEDAEVLANLPNREQALAMLMGVMKAPVEKLVRTLAAPAGKLVRTLAAVRDDKSEGVTAAG